MTTPDLIGEGSGDYPDCTRSGACNAKSYQHAPDCLALQLTDAEQDTGVVPSDTELRWRQSWWTKGAPTS